MPSTGPVLSDQSLSAFRERRPVLAGLPAVAYTSQAVFELEGAKVFENAWTFVGFAHELAKAGDVVPVSVGGQPILLIRNHRDEINGFHNVCRHRGTLLVEAPENVGRSVTCPYHRWAYDLDGHLRAAPYFGGPDQQAPEGFSMDEHGLVAVRTVVWHDWIFVNPGGKAAEFESYAAPLIGRLTDIALSRLRVIGMIDFGVVRTNWKFLIENFIEPYHVQFVHARTTSQPLRDHSTFVDGVCIGCSADLKEGDSKPSGPGRSQRLDVDSRYLTLFPNFVLGWYAPGQLGVHLNVPLGPDRTWQRRALYDDGEAEFSASQIEDLKELWRKVHREDHAICERLQRGRRSPVAEKGGVLSPHWENGVRRFQELIVEALEG